MRFVATNALHGLAKINEVSFLKEICQRQISCRQKRAYEISFLSFISKSE